MGFLGRRKLRKKIEEDLTGLRHRYGLIEKHRWEHSWYATDFWENMVIAERKKTLEKIKEGTLSFNSPGTPYTPTDTSQINPEEDAEKQFSELPELTIFQILALVEHCGFKSLNMIKENEARLQRMDESNNSGMAEYNRRKEKQENFYWKYFRRNSSYIHPEWHGDKPSEDRTSDEELDEIVDEYLLGMHDSDENYEETTTFRHLSYLFITEFAKRREAQSRFTKDSQTEDKKARRGKREITEEDLEGTHYDLLKVSMDASLKEIKEAWKELILKWHPDRHQKNPKLAERMAIALNIAKEVLSDRTKRKKYDEELDQRFV